MNNLTKFYLFLNFDKNFFGPLYFFSFNGYEFTVTHLALFFFKYKVINKFFFVFFFFFTSDFMLFYEPTQRNFFHIKWYLQK